MQDFIFLRVVKFFLEHPYEKVYLRSLSKKLGISPYAIKKYADRLVKEDLLNEERRANLRYFKANLDSLFFRYLKIAYSMNLLNKSKLMDFLKENIANISSIVLFGSMAKGEDEKKSDIDILIIGKQKNLDLSKFEEGMGKEITIHIFSWSEWNKKVKEDKAFYSEIIAHGIPLEGELPLVK